MRLGGKAVHARITVSAFVAFCTPRKQLWESTQAVRATGDKEPATGDSTCSFSPNPNPKEVPARRGSPFIYSRWNSVLFTW